LVPVALIIAPINADAAFDEKMAIVDQAATRSGFVVVRPSRIPEKFDLAGTLDLIRRADLIVADLSHARPSCYYELGLIEACGRQALLIAQHDTEIFQHSGASPVRFYRDLREYRLIFSEIMARK
jgi:nucleoside 2-deoxyribosyltransferase